jgi:hypothetical protein
MSWHSQGIGDFMKIVLGITLMLFTIAPALGQTDTRTAEPLRHSHPKRLRSERDLNFPASIAVNNFRDLGFDFASIV